MHRALSILRLTFHRRYRNGIGPLPTASQKWLTGSCASGLASSHVKPKLSLEDFSTSTFLDTHTVTNFQFVYKFLKCDEWTSTLETQNKNMLHVQNNNKRRWIIRNFITTPVKWGVGEELMAWTRHPGWGYTLHLEGPNLTLHRCCLAIQNSSCQSHGCEMVCEWLIFFVTALYLYLVYDFRPFFCDLQFFRRSNLIISSPVYWF